MRRRRRVPWLALAAVLVVLLPACRGSSDESSPPTSQPSGSSSTLAGDEGGSPSPGAQAGDALTLGLVDIHSLDPLGASPASVSQVVLADLLYDTLTELDDDGTVRPGLATFAPNEDLTVWRFTLGPDATFDDGTPIAADDVVFSLQRVRAQGNASLAALQLEGVQSVATAGPGIVEVTLAAPSAVLPEVLSSPLYGIVDRERTEQGQARGSLVPLGSGDYAITVQGPRRLVLERRRGEGPDAVVLDLFEDQTSAIEAFRAGSVDWAPVLQPVTDDASDLGSEALSPFGGTVMLALTPGVEPLTDKRLRQAIALAIDRGPLVEAVFGPAAQPLLGLVPDGVPGAASHCLDPCGPDLEAARALVAQVFPQGQPRPLRLLVDDSESQQAIAGVLEDQLATVGLEVKTSSLDAETVDQLIRAGKQQLFLFSTLGVSRSPAVHLAPLFRAGSPDNITGYDNQLVAAVIASALEEPVASTRAERWHDVEAAVLDDAPVVPLAQLRTVAATSHRLHGLRIRVDGSIDLAHVRLDDAGG